MEQCYIVFVWNIYLVKCYIVKTTSNTKKNQRSNAVWNRNIWNGATNCSLAIPTLTVSTLNIDFFFFSFFNLIQIFVDQFIRSVTITKNQVIRHFIKYFPVSSQVKFLKSFYWNYTAIIFSISDCVWKKNEYISTFGLFDFY